MKSFAKWRERRAQKKEKVPQKEKKVKRRKKERVENINDPSSIQPKSKIPGMFARVVLWLGLGFMVFLGVMSLARPDPLIEYNRAAAKFMQQQRETKNLEIGLQGFAANFAKEYSTYKSGELQEYVSRVSKYTAENVSFNALTNLRHTTAATYTQVYDIVEYTNNQFDVYVMTSICYESDDPEEAPTTRNSYLRVPVRVLEPGKFVVEDHPLHVAQPTSWKWKQSPYIGREAPKEAVIEIENMIGNFLQAYYGRNQTSVDYFLSEQADKQAFQALQGRYAFERVSNSKVYQHPESTDRYIAIVEHTAQDINGQQVIQQFHLVISKEGQRYYVVEMNTRTGDMAVNGIQPAQ